MLVLLTKNMHLLLSEEAYVLLSEGKEHFVKRCEQQLLE